MRFLLATFLLFSLAAPIAVNAVDEKQFRAVVTHVLSQEVRTLPGTDATVVVQELRAVTQEGEEIFFENDRVVLKVGDAFFGTFLTSESGATIYAVRDPDRRFLLLSVILLFVTTTIGVGGMIGLRSLVSLAFSIGVIVFVLLPLLVSGISPLAVSVLVSALILAFAMAVTHRVTLSTAAAFVASMVTVTFAILLSQFFVSASRIAGFATDESAILNLTTGGALNMEGLLLGAMIIGVLGIIDDLTVTQVSTVRALYAANATLSPRELYRRAMGVGREHLGAVVNTLVLAYAGASLPLLLLFSLSPASPLSLLNSDVMATEIIRAAVGGIALALAIPIATFLGTVVATRHPLTPEEVAKEKHHTHVSNGSHGSHL